MKKILMICLGNICRSPLAEGILRQKAIDYGLDLEIDSAGFEYCNVGMAPDSRAQAVARKYGINIANIRSRLFKYSDFEYFDAIYVMDKYNYNDVISMAKTEQDKAKVDYILNESFPGENRFVKDPYYGGNDGFETVFNQLDDACESLCKRLKGEI